MKILQLNSWSCRLDSEITRLFDKENPDIVCLQEVVSSEHSAGKIIGRIEDILNDHPFEYVYFSPLVQMKYMHGVIQRGNCILSKYPITHRETFFTHGAFQPDFDYDRDGYNIARGVAVATIDTPSGPLHILTTHGYHLKEHKNGNEETLKACREIMTHIGQLDGRVIVAGDFNLAPHSESTEVLNNSLRNLCIENSVPTTRNNLTTKTEVCDYIFVNDAVDVRSFAVLEDVVSDHKALRVEIA